MIERRRTPDGRCDDIQHGPTPGRLSPRHNLPGGMAVSMSEASKHRMEQRAYKARMAERRDAA